MKILDIAYNKARSIYLKGDDWLTASFLAVEQLTPDQCKRLVKESHGNLLSVIDADLTQFAARRAGVQVQWEHYAFNQDWDANNAQNKWGWLDGRNPEPQTNHPPRKGSK